MKDIIVEQVRETRRQIEREYDNAENYLKHVYHAQKQHGNRLVIRQPKILKKRNLSDPS